MANARHDLLSEDDGGMDKNRGLFCVGPQSQAEQKDVAYTLKQFGQTWALLLLSYTTGLL